MRGFQSAQGAVCVWEKPEESRSSTDGSSEEIADKHEELLCRWQDELESSERSRLDLACAVAVAEQAKKLQRRRRISHLHSTLLGRGLVFDR